ncbi:SPOR domain-containing protein [Legionella sp. CNM-1927-20]|uniref:SPOR domain-containing protein n=1 Tax=Legionella sp. CNM-1927-20 TaxID=3422221 RepID=UPI00403AB6F8
MKLIKVIFLALPLFVKNINAATTVLNLKEQATPATLSSLDKDYLNSLNFYQVKGTQKNSPSLHSAAIASSKGMLIENLAILEDSPKLLDWRAKITNSFNKEQFLRLKSLNNPLLTQENRTKINKNSAFKLSESVKWYITAGHFKTKANAVALVSRLKKLGFKVLIQPLTQGTSVLIGPYDFRPHAVISMKELRNIANVQGALIHFKYEFA